MVTGHRLVDGLIQEYWGLFIKWDTAMYQVGTECFVPRSFHSHVSLKVGGIWWFAIHHEFPPVSTECPQKFPWNSTSESETVASHSHINQAELRKFPWYDCPLYKARAIVWFSHIQPYPVAGDSKDVTVSRVSAASLIIFYSHMMSYDPKKNIESPGFRNWDPFFQTATAVRILEVSTRKGVLSTTGHSTNFARDLVDLVDLLYVYHIYCMYSINITKILYMECYYTNDVYHHIPYIYIYVYIYILYSCFFSLSAPFPKPWITGHAHQAEILPSRFLAVWCQWSATVWGKIHGLMGIIWVNSGSMGIFIWFHMI